MDRWRVISQQFWSGWYGRGGQSISSLTNSQNQLSFQKVQQLSIEISWLCFKETNLSLKPTGFTKRTSDKVNAHRVKLRENWINKVSLGKGDSSAKDQ